MKQINVGWFVFMVNVNPLYPNVRTWFNAIFEKTWLNCSRTEVANKQRNVATNGESLTRTRLTVD